MVDLQLLRDKALLFHQFLVDKELIPDELLDAFNNSNRLIEEAFLKKNAKALTATVKDIDYQLKEMSYSMFVELRSLMKERLGIELDASGKADKREAKRIIRKQEIASEDEYRLILELVETLYTDASKTTEVEKLNALLASYHRS